MSLLRTSLWKAAFPLFAILAPIAAGACNGEDVPIGEDQQQIACTTSSDCPGGKVCAAGFCAKPCAVDSDCPASKACIAGACQSPSACTPAAEVCDGIDNDCNGIVDDNATCPGGATCVNGACVAAGCTAVSPCPAGQTCVNGACVTAGCTTDSECPAGQACVGGQCAPACSAVTINCGGSCVNPGTDPDNCGSCGHVCAAGEACVGGNCSPCTCGDGFCAPNCGEAPATCPQDCGAAQCAADSDCGIHAVCQSGACACQAGWVDKDQNQQNGCEFACPGGGVEVCDGLDNDCDGIIDNGNPGGNAPCNTGAAGACASGKTDCTNGVLVCTMITLPTAEVCDGIDNDCNGIVDDNAPCAAGQTCQNGVCAP